MNTNDGPMKYVYIGMAAIAGAVTALSFQQWRRMTTSEIIMTIFVGAAFAIFGVPYIAGDLLHMSNDTLRAACGLTYLGGTFSNALIPLILKKIKKWLKLDEEEVSK